MEITKRTCYTRTQVIVQSAPRIYCEVRETKIEQARPGALPMRRKEPAPGLVTVKELVTEQLREKHVKYETEVPTDENHQGKTYRFVSIIGHQE